MNHCRKCGSHRIGGPTYVNGLDVLRYRCIRCGYSEDRETVDNRRGSASALREGQAGQGQESEPLSSAHGGRETKEGPR